MKFQSLVMIELGGGSSAQQPAFPDDEPTMLEIQRWEDDGGAVPPDAARDKRGEPEQPIEHCRRAA